MRAESPTRVRLNVGRKVAELRAARGLAQEQLAERLNVSVKYLQRVEVGRENLTLDSIVKIANAVRATAHALLAPPDTPRRRRAAPAYRRRAQSSP